MTWDMIDEGCSCVVMRMPPCSWCTDTAECDYCGDRIHVEEEAMLFSSGEVYCRHHRSIRVWGILNGKIKRGSYEVQQDEP